MRPRTLKATLRTPRPAPLRFLRRKSCKQGRLGHNLLHERLRRRLTTTATAPPPAKISARPPAAIERVIQRQGQRQANCAEPLRGNRQHHCKTLGAGIGEGGERGICETCRRTATVHTCGTHSGMRMFRPPDSDHPGWFANVRHGCVALV